MQIPEILLIDKPKGITSFDVIRILRKKFGKIKMGHSGTLDPNATGLMIIGVGEGTKKLKELIGLQKNYEVEIFFGKKTDSGDITGKVIGSMLVPELSEEIILKASESLLGINLLSVPLYSAVRKNGKRMYEYAYKGHVIETPVKEMNLIELELMEHGQETALVRMKVSSGTYIRSLVEELGERLGTLATVKNLRRISIGEFDVKNAQKLEY